MNKRITLVISNDMEKEYPNAIAYLLSKRKNRTALILQCIEFCTQHCSIDLLSGQLILKDIIDDKAIPVSETIINQIPEKKEAFVPLSKPEPKQNSKLSSSSRFPSFLCVNPH